MSTVRKTGFSGIFQPSAENKITISKKILLSLRNDRFEWILHKVVLNHEYDRQRKY